MDKNSNLFIAIIVSAIIMFGWEYFVAMPKMKVEQARQAQLALQQKTAPTPASPAAPEVAAPVASPNVPNILPRTDALKRGGARISILTPTVKGSLLLQGARFDDLRLRKYHDSVDPKSPAIDLLAPSGTQYPYFAEFGWAAANPKIALPNDKTPWTLVGGSVLSPGHPVFLTWDNGQGLIFTRTIGVDDKYMFSVTDSVTNKTAKGTTLHPYALVVRDGVPERQSYWVLHEGFVGVADEKLHDPTYKDFKKDGVPPETFDSTGGWVGITDKYWMTALVPPQSEKFDGAFRSTPFGGDKSYQANYSLAGRDIAPGATVSVTHRMFAGAKVVDTLRGYEQTQGIKMFDYAVDWGWFSILTRPLFWVLDKLNRYLGNFGLAIILATVLIRLVLYPLANAGFKSMSRMKKLQPEMERIKTRFAEDKAKQQQETMELYKREKINPVSGCLPMLVQIPILFSFYKVQLVTIEMFHAPFFGWVKDLSAPDPTSYINLFGLLPFTVPTALPGFLSAATFLLHVGVWPILMGATQWLQNKMNPPAADPMQAKMFAWMPVIFTFMMAAFPVGLVIYWTWNNMLTMAQQYVIMKREGVHIHLVDNLRPPAFVMKLLGRDKP